MARSSPIQDTRQLPPEALGDELVYPPMTRDQFLRSHSEAVLDDTLPDLASFLLPALRVFRDSTSYDPEQFFTTASGSDPATTVFRLTAALGAWFVLTSDRLL